MTYEVDLKFGRNGEPTFFITEDGKLKWPIDKVIMFDWKDTAGAAKGLTKLSKKGGVVELFDGSDAIIYALAEDAIKAKKR